MTQKTEHIIPRSTKCQLGRVRLRDIRSAYLLVGECRGLGNDGIAWRSHLIRRLFDLYQVERVAFVDVHVDRDDRGKAASLRPVSVVQHPTAACPSTLQFRRPQKVSMEASQLGGLLDGQTKIQTLKWDHAMSPRWKHRLGPLRHWLSFGCDDFAKECGLLSLTQLDDTLVQLLFLQRSGEVGAFSRRDERLLQLLWIELLRLQPSELRAVDDSVFLNYPRRMLQVLTCLLAGHTVRETAQLLEISAHTVQEHVKRLYKRSESTNRAELADHFRGVAPMLLSMPLNHFPGALPI